MPDKPKSPPKPRRLPVDVILESLARGVRTLRRRCPHVEEVPLCDCCGRPALDTMMGLCDACAP